jgi:hydroxyethylthiazole kinase-like uncharacterized protein yjeF
MTEPAHIDARNGPWPLHDAASARATEAAALAGHPPFALMQRAGLAVARVAAATAPHARRVLVLAGPGNNGGDGLVAATHLHLQRREVRVVHLADSARLPADARRALADAQAAGVTIVSSIPDDLNGFDLGIDALLGLGTTRAPAGDLARAVDAANSLGAPVIAVDLPSGLDGDSGRVLGAAAVRATLTLCLLTLRPGLFTAAGRDHAGEVWLDRLGVESVAEPSALLAGAAQAFEAIAPRQHAQHKGSFGDVLIVGGAAGMAGAAWLAGEGALAAGAGRVHVSPLDSAAGSFLPQRPELMWRREGWLAPPAALAQTTVVCGCGGGEPVRAALPPLIAHAARLVLDADALNAIAADPSLPALLAARAARGRPTVLTPHPLEAARLLGSDARAVQSDRFAAVRELSQRLHCVVALKGSGTIVCAPGSLPVVNSSGNALLASPGTGDVLAGWIGGLWAALSRDDLGAARQAAVAAVWLHGAAADRARAGGARFPLRAADLAEAMRTIV